MKKSLYILSISFLSCVISLTLYHHYFGSSQKTSINEFSTLVSNKELNLNGSLRSHFTAARPDNFITSARKGTKATVNVLSQTKNKVWNENQHFSKSTGSGILITEDGYIVSNYHVIENASEVKITLDNNQKYQAKVVGFDESTDIALLKIEGNQFPYIPIGNSDSLHVGEWVLAIGSPFNLQSSVTAGIVSAKARNINILHNQGIESFIQTDAVVNPGNSGGPLLNTNGELVGINTAIMTETGNSEGYSFAIPSNLVQKVVFDLIEYGVVQRGWMGVHILDANEFSDKVNNGVLIDLVDKNGAASDGGILKKDIIISINNFDIKSASHFSEQVALYRPGDKLEIELLRGSKKMKKTVVLRNQLNTTDYISIYKNPILKDLGFELRNLDTNEKTRLKKEGIYVVSVKKGTVISNTNMDPGYIITHVNNKMIKDVESFITILESTKSRVFLNGFYENYPGEFPYTFDPI